MTGRSLAPLSLLVLALVAPCLGNSKPVIVSYQQAPVELSCTEAADSVKLKWTLNGVDVTTRKDVSKEFTIFEGNKTLRLLKVEPSTVGTFVCRYTNDTEIETFNIKAKPFIEPFAKAKNVIDGDPLSLECRAWGVPDPVITWFFNETVRLVPDGTTKITLKNNSASSNAKFAAVENNTVRIEEITSVESGYYSCFATVMINGQKYETNATVLVQVKNKYAALWPFLGICVEVAILCAIIIIYEKRRAKRIAEEDRQEEAAHLNAPNDSKTPGSEDVRQRK